MSTSRAIALTASLVWSVENTEMAGEGGLDRDLRRLAITDLADEDDVGILAHDRAQRRAEGETGTLVHLDLHDAGQAILDGILDRDRRSRRAPAPRAARHRASWSCRSPSDR
jgi:hypothetical protein